MFQLFYSLATANVDVIQKKANFVPHVYSDFFQNLVKDKCVCVFFSNKRGHTDDFPWACLNIWFSFVAESTLSFNITTTLFEPLLHIVLIIEGPGVSHSLERPKNTTMCWRTIHINTNQQQNNALHFSFLKFNRLFNQIVAR